jgi:regulator of protease activity HflC (stomatin/prohibitin superfamily)
MESAFGWLGQIIDALLQFIPRLVIVRNTHQAVKWKMFGHVVPIPRGRRTWYWPLVTDIETIVVARQAANIESVSLLTKDGEQVAVGAVLVYWINDVVMAIGERNYDVEEALCEIAQTAIVIEIMKHTLDELIDGIAKGEDGEFAKSLTANCRKQLKRYGVHVDRAGLTEFTTANVYRVIGTSTTLPSMEE